MTTNFQTYTHNGYTTKNGVTSKKTSKQIKDITDSDIKHDCRNVVELVKKLSVPNEDACGACKENSNMCSDTVLRSDEAKLYYMTNRVGAQSLTKPRSFSKKRTRRKISITRNLYTSSFDNIASYRRSYHDRKLGLRSWSLVVLILGYVLFATSEFAMADYYSDYVSLVMKSYSKSACDREYLRIDCPEGTSIDVQGAMYGRKVPSTVMCPSDDWLNTSGDTEEDTNCEAKAGAECQDQRICRLLVHRREFGRDPCPGTSKYLTVNYQCAPKDFRQKSSCAGRRAVMRCRLGTVISIYKIQFTNDSKCAKKDTNKSDCSASESSIFDSVSKKCGFENKCSYPLPTAACFSGIGIIYTCVPKQFLSSEIPTSDRLLATTTVTAVTTQSTEYFTTTEEEASTVQSTVISTSFHKGANTTAPSSTSLSTRRQNSTTRSIFHNITDKSSRAFTAVSITTNKALLRSIDNVTSTVDFTSVTKQPNNDVVVRNDFAPGNRMDEPKQCVNCTSATPTDIGNLQTLFMNLYTFFKENGDDIIIAILLAVIVALVLTICVLVFPCEKKEEKIKSDAITEETREDNSQNVEEQYATHGVEAEEEDEHENMSLLGSILQRSVDSNNTGHRQRPTSENSQVPQRSKVIENQADEGRNSCGPKSIFGKICCNCCCSNAPWQRTRILKRHVYHVTHRSLSSVDEEEITGRLRSQDSFPEFNRAEDNPDHPSPIPILEDHMNRTDHTVVTSQLSTSQTPVTSQPIPPLVSQSQPLSNFRPISRETHRHYSVTPEPDAPYRTQQTFRPQTRQETQRSDPALNIYSVRSQHNVTQPLTAPTSPTINHQTGNHKANGAHKLIRAYPASTPKALPVMGQSMLQNASSHVPQSPVTPKYTPPPTQFYSTQQYPTFAEAYEQYDNAQRDLATRRKQYPSRSHDYPSTSQYHPHQYNQYQTYHTPNPYNSEHFVQAVQRRNTPSNARTVDLAANARTVDLSHNNSSSRNSWLEIRRSSIYDNSLPRGGDMCDYYHQHLQQHELQHAFPHDLPGSRNLNHYYP